MATMDIRISINTIIQITLSPSILSMSLNMLVFLFSLIALIMV